MAPSQDQDSVHATSRSDSADEKQAPLGETSESLPDHDGSETETISHHDERSRDGEADEKSRPSHDETEEHHDPEPEGSEGLNIGVITNPPTLTPARSRTQSRASSARSRPLTIVPRAKRRGLFATLTVIPEVERPYDYSRKTKWTITAIVALAAAGGPIGSNLMYRMDCLARGTCTRVVQEAMANTSSNSRLV